MNTSAHLGTPTLYLVLAIALAASCSGQSKEPLPDFLVSWTMPNHAGDEAEEIWKYQFRGKTVYYVPPRCCDVVGALFSISGDIICSPDGGLTGDGDGSCPTFFEERRGGTLVWKVGQEVSPR